jgi:pyruvate/2-oxoglutarate dehydrogenase complex dihydrolipoamide acyltransferase (E2) component
MKGYKSVPLTFNRKMVIASVNSNKRSAIHCVTEIDVTEPRAMIREIHEKGGKKLSFTAYLVRCLATTLENHPGLNSFIRGRKLVLLDDVTISVLVERDLGEEKMPEPVGILAAQKKSTGQIHNEIREAQKKQVWVDDGFKPREMLHITASFDHEIVDGAPAARFMKEFSGIVEAGDFLNEEA